MRMQMSEEQQRDLADRERQAKSLAAAGMVAETVGRTASHNGHYGSLMNPPPILATGNEEGFGQISPTRVGVMTSVNWGSPEVDVTLEDMEMDFANLFDPVHEMESMQTEGSGWPGTDVSISPTPVTQQQIQHAFVENKDPVT